MDDALVRFMTEEAGYSQSFKYFDIKLAVVLLLNVIGGLTSYYVWKIPFGQGTFVKAIGSGLFVFINCLWTICSFFSPQYVFVGRLDAAKKSKMVYLTTATHLHDPVYRIYGSTDGSNKPLEILAIRVDEWITQDGYVCARKLIPDMKSALGKLGKLE